MSLAVIAVAFALQSAPSHASLHPANIDAFFEVPDLPALIAEYDQAPVFRLLRDENIALSIQELTGEEFDFDGYLTAMLRGGISPDAMGVLRSVQAASLSLQFPAPAGGAEAAPPSFTAVVDFASVEVAQAVLAVLSDSATSSTPHPNSPLEGTVSLQVQELAGLPLWAVTNGTRLIVAGGTIQPSEVALRMAAGDGAGMAGHAGYQACGKHLEPASGATVIQGYSTRSPLDVLSGMSLPGNAAMVLEGIREVVQQFPDFLGGTRRWRLRLAHGRFITEFVSLDPEANATAVVQGGRPMDPAWLDTVDPEAMLLYSTALDGAGLLTDLQSALRGIGRKTGQEIDVAGFEAELGIPLADIFGQLGPGFVAYAKPLRGIAIPESYAWIELRDPGAFAAQVAALADSVGAKFPGFSLRTRDYRVKDQATGERIAFPVSTLTFPPELLELPPMVSVSPAFTVAKGMLLVSLSPMHLKRELKRLYGGNAAAGELDPSTETESPGAGPPGDPGAGEGSRGATAPALSSWSQGLPPNTESVIVMDWGLLIGGLVSMAKSLGPMLPIPFDAQALPEPETITRHFAPTVHYSRRVEGGTYRRNEASFGPEIWIGGVVAGLFAFRDQVASGFGGMVESGPVARAGTKPVGEDGQKLATKMALQKVRMAIAVYRTEFGSPPSSLEDLVQPTDTYPGGFLEEGQVPHDGWGAALHFERDVDAATYRVWSSGPNGIDEGGSGDDISGE